MANVKNAIVKTESYKSHNDYCDEITTKEKNDYRNRSKKIADRFLSIVDQMQTIKKETSLDITTICDIMRDNVYILNEIAETKEIILQHKSILCAQMDSFYDSMNNIINDEN